MVGVLAVEMFLTKRGELWVNELAPRPHNSGHHTIGSTLTSAMSCLPSESASSINLLILMIVRHIFQKRYEK